MGKGRVLTQKEVDKGIYKVIEKKEKEEAAAINRTEKAAIKKIADDAKATREAEYQVACDAALAAGLPKPKRPRAPPKSKAIGGGKVGGSSRAGARGGSTHCAPRGGACRQGGSRGHRAREEVVPAINLEVCNDPDELDEIEVEEQQWILQIQEFFNVSNYLTLVGG